MSSKDEAEALARELRSKTTMPLAWIAARLNMGSRGHLAWLLQQRRSGRLAAPRTSARIYEIEVDRPAPEYGHLDLRFQLAEGAPGNAASSSGGVAIVSTVTLTNRVGMWTRALRKRADRLRGALWQAGRDGLCLAAAFSRVGQCRAGFAVAQFPPAHRPPT
jgi:hypothetical protein